MKHIISSLLLLAASILFAAAPDEKGRSLVAEADGIPEIGNVQDLLAAKAGEFRLLPGVYSIFGNVTLPDLVTLHVSRGAVFQINAGAKLEVKARIHADERDLLWKGSGAVELYPTAMNQISVSHFGAIPGDKIDDTEAINKAIASGFRIASIYFPGAEYYKTYDISSTITFFHSSRVANWVVTGQKTADGVALEEVCSRIYYTGKSGPCFNFRGQRLARLENLNMVGDNTQAAEMAEHQRNTTKPWNPANWNSDGLSMDRFNVHSAVAFDWGKDGADGAPWSATCQVRNMVITNFVLAISISPNNGYQGDTYGFDNIKIKHCTYGVSIGQDQARAVNFSNMWMDGLYCAYTNNEFGRRNGSAFNVVGGTQQYTNIFKLLQTTTAYRGQSLFAGLFLEACGILGTIDGLGINQNATVFTGCEFGTDDNGWFETNGLQWITPMLFCNAGTNVNFIGCNFNIKKEMLAFAGGFYQFQGCSFGMTTKVYFNNPLEVSITGRPNFRLEKRVSMQDVLPLHESDKMYVRPTAQMVQLYNAGETLPQFELKPLQCMIPTWWQVAFVKLPDTQAKEFEITLQEFEIKRLRVGDYLQAKAGNAFGSKGVDLSFGDMQLPALKVIAKNGTRLRLQRLGPEVQVSSQLVTGSLFTGFHVFLAKDAAKKMSPGDMVNVGGTVTRVLDNGQLADNVKGPIYSMKY